MKNISNPNPKSKSLVSLITIHTILSRGDFNGTKASLYLVIVTIQAFKSDSQGLHNSPSHNWFLLTKFFELILHVASQR